MPRGWRDEHSTEGQKMAAKEVTIVIEDTGNNYSAYCLEVPGCIATGATKNDAYRNMIDALNFHMKGVKGEEERGH